MEFKTSISKMTDNDMVLRGEKLSDLIKESTFAQAIFLILSGRKPNEKELKIFEAMLVSVIDHGMGTTSALASRIAVSGGNGVNAGISAGVLALGDYHGGAIELAMNQIKQAVDKKTSAQDFVKNNLESKATIYGFGHKVYKDVDPRVKQLLEVFESQAFVSEFVTYVLEVEEEIKQQKGKKIPLNVDGLLGAVLLEMGFNANQGKAFFIIARTPGLAAQAIEEIETEKPVRRINEEEITYEGK